jgi:hypothetical protein
VADDRGTYSALGCVPLVDGLPAGLAQPLSSNAEAVGRASASGMFDPRTGGFEQLSPGNFPDTQWSILRQYSVASDGRHQVALECEAGAAFRFRGLATLSVRQEASGD